MCCFNQSQIKRDAQEIVFKEKRTITIRNKDDEITSSFK